MAYHDRFRLSSHAVITNQDNQVLMLKATYGECGWGLPGGSFDPGETIHEALERECREELGVNVVAHHLTGVYYHSAYESQSFIFRCELAEPAPIQLSFEHSEYRYFSLDELNDMQRRRIEDCLGYAGVVSSAKF
ncbi:NUDIX hydrolase [Metapseudomonas resinovorans]|uniref:Putative hydrolase n=1 Tax=Metapseudomonas resinovorans NBRC 106553 TaxID=1245471 RepID=S6AT83_METRE|nr:NUDIX domain-containing protein [Pseudomonas resinovorans]BAN47376.1 putative hydrolase [Pseudomonas resinovorans NBRC 106553]